MLLALHPFSFFDTSFAYSHVTQIHLCPRAPNASEEACAGDLRSLQGPTTSPST